MSQINWSNLRAWNGSQQAGFEELCSQLANYEPIANKNKFYKKGAPDAGVECFWQLDNGDEIAWQAKFFLAPPTSNQWSQINESVNTALEKHPRLTEYIVCLPIDRADSRIVNQKSFLQKWEDRVKDWKKFASSKGREVEFDFWGNFEIGERLSREEHSGRYAFWFNRIDFSQEWFNKRLDESIADAGPRYSPKLHVELPIAFNYKAQALCNSYFDELLSKLGKYLKNAKTCVALYSNELQKSDIEIAHEIQKQISNWIHDLKTFTRSSYDNKGLIELIKKLDSFIDSHFDEIFKNSMRKDEANNKKKEKYSTPRDMANYIKHSRDESSASSHEFQIFLEDQASSLVNYPFSLLVGNAGNGKTHLFADIAKNLLGENIPAILILGEKLSLGNPWSQILEALNLLCTRDEFLGAFQSASEARNSRGIIFLDALNESENKTKWSSHISGMISAISNYPNIGLAISVRSSYEDLIVPSHLQNNFIRIVHQGFGSKLTKAVQIYFTYHNISLPSVPLLSPEFNNPLFLGVFCRTLEKLGLTEIPEGMSGFFSIFNEFLNSINVRLSKPEYLDFDPADNLVFKFIDKYCEKLSESDLTWLPVDDVRTITKSIYPTESGSKSLFRHLISEGIIAEDRFYKKGNWEEGVRFCYERFSDFFTASKIIETCPNQEKLNTVIKNIFPNSNACYFKRGLLDAFSIQYPEIYGEELISKIPELKKIDIAKESIFESLLWRSAKSINDGTVKEVTSIANSTDYFFRSFTEMLLYLAPKENHRFNAFYLDKNLKRFKMPDRDEWWTIYINDAFNDDSPLGRAINWIMEMDDTSNAALSIDARFQISVMLSWCFTASNRHLRDRSTKAVAKLLENHLEVAGKLFNNFSQIDDLYILERVLASCMGAATRSKRIEGLEKLSASIFNEIFKENKPPAHLVARDYARTICELALLKIPNLNISKKLIRPPYKSDWPTNITSKKIIESKFGKLHDKMTEEEHGMYSIYSSVMGYGDFARYIIGTNFHSFDWTSSRLRGKKIKTSKEQLGSFVDSLTEKQLKNWKLLETVRLNISFRKRLGEYKKEKEEHLSKKELKELYKNMELMFINSLRGKKRDLYKSQIIPFLNNPNAKKYTNDFDLSLAQRFVISRVFELGWTKDKFGIFDRRVNWYDYSRTASKNERIGKKYQWLAWFEFLARVSDNFVFKGDLFDPKGATYEGPWQISYGRNIDPSLLVQKSHRDRYKTSTPNWWNNVEFNDWKSEDEIAWLKSEEILPKIENLIFAEDDNKKSWVVLDLFPEWYESLSPEVHRYDTPRKRIWFMLKSYVVKSADFKKFVNWGKKQDFMGRWMPELREIHNIFWGEHFWAPAYKYINQPYYSRPGWSDRNSKIPVAILATCEQYMCESSGYDCSIDETVHFNILNSWIAEKLALERSGEESKLMLGDEVYSFDPSLTNQGAGALIADKRILDDLGSIGYGIVWTWLGEKDILVGDDREKWKGRLEISGISYLDKGVLKTIKNFKFKSPHEQK